MKQKIVIVLIAVFVFGIQKAFSYPLSYYTSNSKLSQGKWVKIRVPESGVYEITYDKLQEWGFSNPQNVRIYGRGGEMLPETFSVDVPDDIQQIPMKRSENKIIFYGIGGRQIHEISVAYANLRYIPQINCYSSYGYYLLTESTEDVAKNIKIISTENNGSTNRNFSHYYSYHEEESVSLGNTGRTFFGESLLGTLSTTIDMPTPGMVEGESAYLTVSAAMSANSTGKIYAIVDGVSVDFITNSDIRSNLNDYVYYNSSAPGLSYTPASTTGISKVTMGINCTGKVKRANLDYIMITYKRYNSLMNGVSQQWMGMLNNKATDKIQISDDSDGTVVWNMTNRNEPVEYTVESSKQSDNSYLATFSPNIDSEWTNFVAFNPHKTLLQPEYVEIVENQNLHGMAAPDMVIITTSNLIPEAERIAQFHREKDGMTVAVVDHNKIINEFSNGTPDAMAYRRFNKMLWDKDKTKFKHLLLFGAGTYDNRGVSGTHGEELLLTYQSEESRDETLSYTTDDFFGFMDDASGMNNTADKNLLSIGRMPVSNVMQAKNAVDKLLEYIDNSNFGDWRNNMLLISDMGDENLHTKQSEALQTYFQTDLNSQMHIYKVYADGYPTSSNRNENACNKIAEYLKTGQLMVSYIGHGSPKFLSRVSVWRISDVKENKYKHLPFITFATCDVARYDSDQKGIAEEMFHMNDGGLVACMAASRSVYASENDQLNRAFFKNLMIAGDKGASTTIGEAFRDAKLSLKSNSVNKLNFLIMGDPAMKLSYPQSKVKITSINGVSPESVSINPMTRVELKGAVMNPDGSINTDFNGKLSSKLWEAPTLYKELNIGTVANPVIHKAYFENDEITAGSCVVKNGEFTLSLVIPRSNKAANENVSLSFYAYNEKTNEMVNGKESVYVTTFDSSVAIQDDESPVINEMYINTPEFKDGDIVGQKSLLQIEFSDNLCLSSQSIKIGNTPTLKVDGKETYRDVANAVSLSDDGKRGVISYEFTDLSYGLHTATISLSDAADNRTSRSISFYVGQHDIVANLEVEESPARDNVTFVFDHQYESAIPSVSIKVTDVDGKIVWTGSTSTFPYQWDLTDSKGNRVQPGVYEFYGVVNAGTQYGHTATKKIIVIKQ